MRAFLHLCLACAMCAGLGLWFRRPPDGPPSPPASRARQVPTHAAASESVRVAPEERVPIVHLNRASLAELDDLPGIGPVLARAILHYRAVHGSFESAEELTLIPGIGARKWARLRGRVAP